MVARVPREVRNDLFQPVLVTNDNTVTSDWTILDSSLALFHCSPKGASGNLSVTRG